MRLRFDRGTVLLTEPPAGLDLSDLPGVLWDERVSALRAPGVFLEEIRAALAARGVRAEDLAGRPADLPVRPVEPSLRPYQEAALWAWQRAGRRGLVVLPTGSGKTRLAIAAIARCGGPALDLVPTRALMAQWADELTRTCPGPIGCLGDGERRVEAITVATFESGWRQMERLGDRFRLLVVDEAHHLGDGQRDEALELCAAPARLGPTATPPRAPAAGRLAALLGPTVFELAVGELAGRWLAPYAVVTLRLELDAGERAAWERAVATYRPVLQAYQRSQPGAAWADFARDFGRAAPGWALVREPEPVAAGGHLLFPDFAAFPRGEPGRRWLVEIVGFWTPEYLATKLARLREARIENLVLCIDEARNVGEGDLPLGARLVRYRRRVDVRRVLEAMGAPAMPRSGG